MKCSESWLRSWVNPSLTNNELAETLTMAGLEVEEIAPVAKPFSQVVIGRVLTVKKHPEAQRLHLCEVEVGENKKLNIVCGAANVQEGLKVAVALIGASLPNGMEIKATKIRGEPSEGMLCSESELGLADESEGIVELAQDAPIGELLRDYLKLDDYTIDIGITPNRGDCLSIKGLAREISALTLTPIKAPEVADVPAESNDSLEVENNASPACPRYIGRIIRGINPAATSPIWLKESLRRSNIRSIHPVVDVTNYVMLELGQPMHVFDLNKINKKIIVRLSEAGESIELLDGSNQTLDAETLVIADEASPLAIAGVMGGVNSSVTKETTDIFLESAFFSPQTVARQRQFYNLNSDSAYRFERGVDPTLQMEAIERATQLILSITGGKAGLVIENLHNEHLPIRLPIILNREKISQLLGISISDEEIEAILTRLHFSFEAQGDGWLITRPFYRFDISFQEDVIEEIARLYGYNNIPVHSLKAQLQTSAMTESDQDLQAIKQAFVNYGYHEIISYSFVEKNLQALLNPAYSVKELVNPITADMSVMRSNLWPGLLQALLYNQSRQQHRIRLFEIGTCFVMKGEALEQSLVLGGVVTGSASVEQWGVPNREVDFFDVKGDLEDILHLALPGHKVSFEVGEHPALHPGQTATILVDGVKVGTIGAIHPSVVQKLDLSQRVFAFELSVQVFSTPPKITFKEISKFPEIRRDLAILVQQAIPVVTIQDTIRDIAGDWLNDVFIFDVYTGKGVTPGLKSVAIALKLQHPSKTLVDQEVTELMERVVSALRVQLGAELRS